MNDYLTVVHAVYEPTCAIFCLSKRRVLVTVSPSCIYYTTSFKRHYNIAKIYSHTKMHTHCIFSTLKYTLSIFLMLHHCYHCLIHHNTLTTISRTTIFCSPITTRRKLVAGARSNVALCNHLRYKIFLDSKISIWYFVSVILNSQFFFQLHFSHGVNDPFISTSS